MQNNTDDNRELDPIAPILATINASRGMATLQPGPDAIRHARIAAGHTQEQAGQLVHVAGRAWRRWETGERAINPACWELYLIKTLGQTLGKLPRK